MTDFSIERQAAARMGEIPQARAAWLAASAYLLLLLLAYVGLDAFSPPPMVSHFGGVQEASKGDLLRQILYLGAGALALVAAVRARGLEAIRAMPIPMALVLVWCMASALWAPEPNVVIRRAGLEVVAVSALLLSVDTLGARKAFHLWRWLLAGVLLVNFISIPLIPVARHLAGETDPALVGNWRGLYGHKNIAGAVCALTVILFLFTRTGWKNSIGIAIAAAATVFLVMTHSKTSMGLLPLALAAGLAYRLSWRDGLGRAILCTIALLVGALLVTGALMEANVILHALENPREFTGRAAIWAAELRYIADHPLLGAGFGTFADTGNLSPLANYVHNRWVEGVSHGHNGYLQVLVTTGGIGFALTCLAAVLWPLTRFWPLDQEKDGFRAMLFALFVFLILHNFMESDFLEGDSVSWVALLLVIGALNRLSPSRSASSQ